MVLEIIGIRRVVMGWRILNLISIPSFPFDILVLQQAFGRHPYIHEASQCDEMCVLERVKILYNLDW